MFGIPLIESVNYARTRISFNDEVTGKACNGFIPIIIAKCGAFLKDEGFFYDFIVSCYTQHINDLH